MKRTTLLLLASACVTTTALAQNATRGGYYQQPDRYVAMETQAPPVYYDNRRGSIDRNTTGSIRWGYSGSHVDSGDFYQGAMRPN